VTDATILIPTFRHAALVPFAVQSALDQEGVTVEVFVVGDGVEDDTRAALEPFAADERVRFFDFPKGERHGELHRHEALREANGRIVCYLSDDDLLLRGHAAEMTRLLENADFAHSVPARLAVDGTLEYFPWNLSRAEFVEVGLGRKASIGLTGTAHTLEAYRRLPHGWRTTPPGGPTDHYMWRQWLELPGFRGAMGDRLTYLTFPDPWWGRLPPAERAASLEDWLRRSREPGFEEELETLLRAAIRRAAEDYHLWARGEQLNVEAMRATRTWRLRERLVSAPPLRALRARRREAR
jgi:GalNAc5-diNAcBac-PP-undecaprenol beta-1,3-glucosyltransferase